MNILQWLTLVFSLAVVMSSAGKSAAKDVIEDQHVGKTEQVILAEFGKPKSTTTVAAKELGDELRRAVREKYFARRPNTQVRELYYKDKKGETIFWLTEKYGKWVVVTDIWIAPGVQF